MRMSIEDGAKHLRRFNANLNRYSAEAVQESFSDGIKVARKWSSGTVKTGPGYRPYAVRDPQNPPDPAIINVRSGIFRDSWLFEGPRVTFGVVWAKLKNIASYAGFMRGTKVMVERPVLLAIKAEFSPLLGARLKKKIVDKFYNPKG